MEKYVFLNAPTDAQGEQMWAIIYGPQNASVGHFTQHQRSWYFQPERLHRWAAPSPHAGFEMGFGHRSPDYAFSVWALMQSGKVVTMSERSSQTWLEQYAPAGFVRDWANASGLVEFISASTQAWEAMPPPRAGDPATPFLVCRPTLHDFVRSNGERCTNRQQINMPFTAYCMDERSSGMLTDGLMLRPGDNESTSWSTIALFVDHEGITRAAIASSPAVIARIPERT